MTVTNERLIEWVDELPSSVLGRHAWGTEISRQLRERPGQWALIDVDPERGPRIHNRKRTVAKGLTRPWRPEGDFEGYACHVAGELRLYARYVGGEGK